MTSHRITYDIDSTPAGDRYTAVCKCGARRAAFNTTAVSAWGPAHVVTAHEADQRK